MGLTRRYKTTVFTHVFIIFLLNIFYRYMLSHKHVYGFVKAKESHIGILLPVSISFCESNRWRCSYDVKIFKMVATDVANQFPVPVW